MRHLGPWQCLAGCTLLFAASSHATVYEINSTDDPSVSVTEEGSAEQTAWKATTSLADGFCSLREAVYASNYRIEVDGCAAGTGVDTVRLKEGTTYTLTQGELPLGIGEKIVIESDGEEPPTYNVSKEPIPNQLSVAMQLEPFEEPDGKDFPIISGDGASRIFNLDEGGILVMTNVELENGFSGANDGGLIYAMGPVTLNTNVTLRGGVATNGGAIYLTEGGGMAFKNGGRFEGNVATQNGAVIATSPTFNGSIVGYDFYMSGNEAQSGASDAGIIHVDGDPATRIGMELANGTITHNLGGVINVLSENYVSFLVNMTIAFNDGTALTLAETAFADPADAVTTDHILHTVMVGNTNACGGVLDSSYVFNNPDAAPRFLFTITDDSACPQPDEQTLGTPVTSNPNGADVDVLLGEGRVPCGDDTVYAGLTSGPGACTPMSAEEIGGPYPAYMPNPLPAAVDPGSPDYIADDAASLFDRGNPENVAVDQCEATDNRGESRGGPGGRCDVGAVEFLRALAQPDEIDLISGRSVLGDVIANDLNDTQVDCRRLDDIVVDEGACTLGDTTCINQAVLDRCLVVVEPPERGSAVPVIDGNGYPRIRYTPGSSFHGVDQIRYQVDKDAFFGGTDLGLDQGEITNFVASPASGLTENKSIADSGGAQSVVMLWMMIVAGMARRYRSWLRGLVAAVALITGGQALAVDIEVNSLADDVPPIKNDGQCTLREALENAAQAGSPDCAYGGSSTDTILLPAGDIQLQDTLIIEGGGIELLGKGALDKDPGDDEETLSRILGDGTFRLFEVQPPNSSSGHPSVRFQFLTLESGYAPGAGETGSGAVIVTGGSVIFDRVRILNNEAEASGGVAFIRSNAGNEKILTFNNSFVSGNTAGVSGGVMSSNAQNGETFKLVSVGSTFEGNSAVNEGGVLDANIAAGEVQIVNSTFVNNSAGQKGSALDLSGITVRANIMNSSFMNNTGSSGIDLGDAPSEIRLSNSAYFNSGNSCTSGTTILHDSQYNAFSGTACAATTESDNQSSTGAASLSATLSDPEGEGASDDYLPPYLPIVDAATDSVLVDMGNDQDLASGTGSPAACRTEDLRGIARTSGGRCDIGAFEYQQITAEDDEGSNQNIPARKVPVDILDNDLPSDGAEFGLLTNSPTFDFTFEHAELVTLDPEEFTGTGEDYDQDSTDRTLFTLNNPVDTSMDGATIRFVWRYYNEERDGYDLKCGDTIPQDIIDENPNLFEDGDIADECVVLFTPPSNADFENRMCTSTSDSPVKVAFLYTFTDSAGQTSNEATAVMTVRDKPPTLEGDSVVNLPGQKVVFKLVVSDPDHPDAAIDWSRYDVTIASEPDFAKKNEDGEVLGVGILIDDDDEGTVTYIPESNYNTFKDTFALKVEDTLCNTTSQQVRYSVRYINEETSAAAGSVGWALLGSVLLLLRRRFAAA